MRDEWPAITVPHIGTGGHIWTDFCRFFSIRDRVTMAGLAGSYNLLNFHDHIANPAGTCLAERIGQGYDTHVVKEVSHERKE